jgi:aminoglycoside phosphotransferase (APT) family kinase protein
MIGATLPVVWIHGDYKLENLILDEGTRQVRAVIDWELGAPLGLPLADLFYLLCYKRVTEGEVDDVLDCVAPQLIEQNWGPDKAMLANYLKLFDLDGAFAPLAVTVYVLQHIGLRYRYDANDAAAQRRLASALDSLDAMWAEGAA